MAIAAPVNLNRLLDLDESLNELDPSFLEMLGGSTSRAKPDLDDALNNEYFKRTGKRLAPGQLPEPVPLDPETLQAGKTTWQKGKELLPSISMPSFGSTESAPEEPLAPAPGSPYVSRRARQDIMAAPGADAPIIRPTVIPEPSITPAATPRGDEPSYLYNTLQKHAAFVRDVLEGGGTLISDIATGGFGAALKVSDILNATVERFASGKPFEGRSESPTFYRDLLKKSDDIVSNVTYTPKSDIAKNVRGATGKVFEVFHDIAALPAKALTAGGVIDEDTAAVVGFATELYLFYKLDRGVRDAAPELRAKIANVKEKFSKGTEGEARAAAEDLADAAARNPNLDGAMNEARGKFRDEGEAEAARGPVGPTPGGPAPAGTYYDPADISAYTTRVQDFAAQFKRDNPNASIRDLRDALENIPKPEPRPQPETPQRSAPEAARPTEPVTPAAEPTRVTPEGDVILSEDLRTYVDGQIAAGMNVDQIVRNVRPSVDASISNAQIREAVRTQTPAVPVAPLRPEDIPPGEMVVRPRVETPAETAAAESQAVVPPEAAAVATREVLPPSSRELPIAAAVPSTEPIVVTDFDILPPEAAPPSVAATPTQVAAVTPSDAIPQASQVGTPVTAAIPPNPARALYERANAMGMTDAQYKATLAELKAVVREGLRPNQSARGNLEKLGFSPEEIPLLDKQLKGVRAKAAPAQPAVQTATIEAVLETAPAGTEVEISRPAEPVVDTSPAIEKPLRKRRVVKAPDEAQLAREASAESLITEMRGQREQQVNQRAHIAEQLRSANQNVPTVLAEVQRAYDSGIRPNDMRATLRDRGIPDDVAREVTDTAYDLHVRGNSLVTGTGPVAEVAARTGVETGAAPVSSERIPADLFQYHNIPNINTLQNSASTIPALPGVTNLPQAPIHLRAKQGAKPDAVFVDTARLNTRTTLADINTQTASGRMSADVAEMMKANLQRQADIAGVPIEEAHNFTGTELMREATRVAAETGINLYVKKGKNYELVPKDVVAMDNRINSGDELKPVSVSKNDAGAYVESKTSDIGPDTIREIKQAIELGIDISEQLPQELLQHYRDMVAQERAGIETSEPRPEADILADTETVREAIKGPRLRGVRGTRARDILADEGGFIDISAISDAVKMAAQRLQADARKAGKGIREFLFGARPEDVAMFENYLERINNPVPSDSTNPRNMRFDPTNIIPGDRIVKQREVSKSLGLYAPPLWQSEVSALQSAKDIRPGGTMWDLKLPYWQNKAAGTDFIYYAYRTAQKNVDASLRDLRDDMTELSRGFSSRSLENVGANGYQRQGADGQRILAYNKVTPTPLSPAEQTLQANIDGIYADFWNKVNEGRIARGKEPLPPVDNYQTFARTRSVMNNLGQGLNLMKDSAADIMAQYMHNKSTNFPYTTLRKHAVYSAEMNALKILDTYAQSVLKEIHLSPFIAKLDELIGTKLPDPTTGKLEWSLKDEKPGLYLELQRWNDYLATGSNLDMPELARYWLNTANRNLGYALLSGSLRSGLIQVSTIRNTYQALGAVPTFKGAVSHLLDVVSGGRKWDFALRNSEVLNSRKYVDAYNDVAGAIIGRNPRDFMTAIARGNVGEIQQVLGQAGMKLLEIPDMQAAVMAWNAAYTHATGKKMGYNHKDAIRFADDLVVRTQGSTMPGDLAGVQRNALGKALTQFQTFAISDWNFLTHEVFGKDQGISTKQMVVNVLRLVMATQTINELYRLIHVQGPFSELIRDYRKGALAGLSNLIEQIPILAPTKYGRGMGGPLLETSRDFARAARGDPMTPNPFQKQYEELGLPRETAKKASQMTEPTATLLGVPFTRQISKTVKGLNRGESVTDSLLGWYSDQPRGRERSERRERRR